MLGRFLRGYELDDDFELDDTDANRILYDENGYIPSKNKNKKKKRKVRASKLRSKKN